MTISSNVLLEGNLGPISLPNLLQLIALEQKTAVLSLSRVEIGQSAELVFRTGELVNARVNSLVGDLAVYRIIAWWSAGTFKLVSLDNEVDLPPPDINSRVDYLLLEGMRQMDATQQYRELVPYLTSAVSFTQSALNSFNWDTADPPEWIPSYVRGLPRSFTMAQLHHACNLDEIRLAHLMRMLLATQAVRVHGEGGGPSESGYGFGGNGARATRYEAFAQLLMEYVGYETAYGLLDQVLYDLAWTDIDAATFGQLLDLCDRLSHALANHLERRQLNDVMRRLRARATSLV
ncbi:MAG: DUF4388 domain-containing protein [Candidatus Sericytochromatia bacterium]|nr:DUF4388 domain-containing protein [Candidatus Sericytochromatia bacterium]